MDKKSFNPNYSAILGLCGKAGTGKTSVANMIVPKAQIALVQEDDEAPIIELDHLFFAMPLYELASIKRHITGEKARDRMHFEVHNVLLDLFGGSPLYGVPPYKEFVNVVETIVDMPIERNLDKKPRTFLQNAGSLCREIDPDCFVNWVKKTIKKRGAAAIEKDRDYICIVSDIRMPNEAKMIAYQTNGIVIRFDASDSVRKDRLYNRDGFLMSAEQASHVSENVESIPDEYISASLDTDDLTLESQTAATKKLLNEYLEGINLG